MIRYPWDLLPKLASEIEHCQKEPAHRDLEDLLRITKKQSHGSLSLFKLRCAQISSFCARGALQGGAPSDVTLEELLDLLKKINRGGAWKTVFRVMHQYIDLLLARVRPMQSTNMERAVAEIRRRIGESPDHPLSLAQYAGMLEVSAGHLSRSFAAMTGRTFRSEMRRIRTEKARELLTRTNLKIGTIAARVGLRDPSQFISDFRHELGLTPGQYRKVHHAKLSRL